MKSFVVLAVLLQLGAAVKNAKYVGCFKDTGDRALKGQWTNGADINNQVCIDRCAAQGFKYAATQYASHCFCGNTGHDRFGPATNCNMACAADSSDTCGGGWANQVYEVESLELERVGCFADKGDRAIVGLWYDSSMLTNKICVDTCRDLGYEFAATQYSSHCFCGDDYDRYGTSASCNMACSGDNKQICGGPWSNTVFRTGSKGKAKKAPKATETGCYRDAGDRAMKGLWTHSTAMTNAICQMLCQTMGTAYAATQYSTHCFCGDSYDKYGQATNCNMACGGQSSEKCGGGWANQVYAIEASKPEPKPEPKPKPEPEPETCAKQRASFAELDIPVDPEFTDDCKFVAKQCNDKKCFCLKARTGELDYDGVEIPLGESYDCSRKARKCEKKRFSNIFKDKDFIPECSSSGKYKPKQCQGDECWCVKTKSGKERKNTRTTGNLSC